MPGRFDQPEPYDEEWDSGDLEAPQQRDLTDEDEDETPTVPCPSCGRPIPDFADRCHHCGDWVVQTAGPPARTRPWFIAAVLIALLSILVWWIL
jgi:hypothetical protein